MFCGYPSFQQIPRAAVFGQTFSAIPGMRTLLKTPCNWLAHRRSQPKLSGIPMFMGSLEGMYFLRRSIFLPTELPALMGENMALEGLNRLGNWPPGMICADARDGAAAIGLFESTHYLRHQLLRDSDWASMAHSLELRTPLVDAKVLETLGPYVSAFQNGAGKLMLARSPGKPLPDEIINRPKTGFSLPMAKWLSEASDSLKWTDLPTLAKPGTPWARRWARIVVERMTACV